MQRAEGLTELLRRNTAVPDSAVPSGVWVALKGEDTFTWTAETSGPPQVRERLSWGRSFHGPAGQDRQTEDPYSLDTGEMTWVREENTERVTIRCLLVGAVRNVGPLPFRLVPRPLGELQLHSLEDQGRSSSLLIEGFQGI